MLARSIPRVLRHRLCFAFAGLIVTAGPASAQGFLDNLFGFGRAPRSAPVSRPPGPASFGYRVPLYYPEGERRRDREPEQRDVRSGSYRTLCVRLCDGYYFPISDSARRTSFYNDANVCRARCGGDARLFFYTMKSEEPADMVDVNGRAYARLPTAFLYRKQYVSGCKCKPDPWALSERERHRVYVQEERARTAMREEAPTAARADTKADHPFEPPSMAKVVTAVDLAQSTPEDADASREDRPAPVSRPIDTNQTSEPPPVGMDGTPPAAPRAATRASDRSETRGESRRRKPERREPNARSQTAVRRAPAKAGGSVLGSGGGLRWPGD